MKNLILIAFLMVSVFTVSASDSKMTRKEKKAEKEALLTEQTKMIVADETWYFDANHMIPSNGRSRSIMNYSVQIAEGDIYSYLPYAGRAYSAGYDSNDSPLVFDSQLEDYTISETKKGGYTIKFKVKNQNDQLDYTLNVTRTGSATLSVNSSKRQSISYYGNIVPVESKQMGYNDAK